MNGTVRVRLVPKSRHGDSLTLNLAEITPATAKHFAPDPARAGDAERVALNLGMQATITANNSISAIVSDDNFSSLFGIAVREKKKEIPVPDEMKDTIALEIIYDSAQLDLILSWRGSLCSARGHLHEERIRNEGAFYEWTNRRGSILVEECGGAAADSCDCREIIQRGGGGGR